MREVSFLPPINTMGGACSSSDLKFSCPFGSCQGGACTSSRFSKQNEAALEVTVDLQLKAIESLEKMIETLKAELATHSLPDQPELKRDN